MSLSHVVGHRVGHRVGHVVGRGPAPIALGALAWWDPNDDAYFDFDVGVRDYTDRIGSRVATQSVGANQPVRIASDSDMGGNASVSFDSSDRLELTGLAGLLDSGVTLWCEFFAPSGTARGTVMTVRSTGGGTNFGIAAMFTKNDAVNPFAYGFMRDDATVQVSLFGGPYIIDTHHWMIMRVPSGAGTYRLRTSLSELSAAAPGGAFTPDILQIGNAPEWASACKIGHCGVFDRYLSDADVADLETWLASLL